MRRGIFDASSAAASEPRVPASSVTEAAATATPADLMKPRRSIAWAILILRFKRYEVHLRQRAGAVSRRQLPRHRSLPRLPAPAVPPASPALLQAGSTLEYYIFQNQARKTPSQGGARNA